MNKEFFLKYENLLEDLIKIVPDQNYFRPHLVKILITGKTN